MGMNATERRELRTLVRQRMKVLHADVDQRRIELIAEVDKRIHDRYADQDKLVADLNYRLSQIADQAFKDMRELIEPVAQQYRLVQTKSMVYPTIGCDRSDRADLRRAMISGIEAQVGQAHRDLDRKEADLLQQLMLDSIESTAARAFMSAIPTVAQLVPEARLAEIEASFTPPD